MAGKKYKLMYFDIKALAEPIRFLFKYGNIDFEDYRYTKEEWIDKIKPTAPFGQGPLLEVTSADGTKEVLWQSVAIQRYIAGLVGLRGDSEWEKLEVDMMVETLWDLRCLLYYWYFNLKENETVKAQVLKERVPDLLERLDKRIESSGGYFVGGKLTWPDLQYTAMFEYLAIMMENPVFDEPYKNLRALRKKVSEIPAIKTWMDQRPKSEW